MNFGSFFWHQKMLSQFGEFQLFYIQLNGKKLLLVGLVHHSFWSWHQFKNVTTIYEFSRDFRPKVRIHVFFYYFRQGITLKNSSIRQLKLDFRWSIKIKIIYVFQTFFSKIKARPELFICSDSKQSCSKSFSMQTLASPREKRWLKLVGVHHEEILERECWRHDSPGYTQPNIVVTTSGNSDVHWYSDTGCHNFYIQRLIW